MTLEDVIKQIEDSMRSASADDRERLLVKLSAAKEQLEIEKSR